MTNSTKTFLSAVIFFTVISFAVKAQTNVSGGIYSNTTWTKANSPYIVTDTVVVFPGDTLTIEPGVTVKFDSSQYLEIRGSALIAIGTSTDSITFTSNSNNPKPGIWNAIALDQSPKSCQFSYCNVMYATTGIGFGINDTVKINNSIFNSNKTGVSGSGNGFIDTCIFINNSSLGLNGHFRSINYCIFKNNNTGCSCTMFALGGLQNCVIDSNQTGLVINGNVSNCIIKYNQTGLDITGSVNNCIIKYNQTGLILDIYQIGGLNVQNSVIDSNSVVGVIASGGMDGDLDSVTNCEIKYNGIGLEDEGGDNVIIGNVIENNNIGILQGESGDLIACNNICNNVRYDFKYLAAKNYNITNNYWCSTDSTTIASSIFDAHDSIALGLVTFIPFDAVACNGITAGIPSVTRDFLFNIYPNPASDYFTLFVPENSINGRLKIYNLLGELTYASTILKQETNIDVSALAKGIYIVEVSYGDNFSREKFIKE